MVFPEALPVLHRPLSAPVTPGTPDTAHGRHIIAWIREGVELCQSGKARALVTCPIAKSVLYATGFKFPGHTEYLAELCRYEGADGVAPHPVMMLTAPDVANNSELRVVLATIHTPLAQVARARCPTPASGANWRRSWPTTPWSSRDFNDRAAAPGHGRAQSATPARTAPSAARRSTSLRPAVLPACKTKSCLRFEIDVSGSLSRPTACSTKTHGAAMTRCWCMCIDDQGLIPLKTLDFWGGVNITLGLPIVRTSPDHGTWFRWHCRQGCCPCRQPDQRHIRTAAKIAEDRIAQNRRVA